MILVILIAVLLVAGLLAWLEGDRAPHWARWLCIVALVFDLVVTVILWLSAPVSALMAGVSASSHWLASVRWQWMPALGIDFHLGMDGLSLLLVALTLLLGLVAVVASWHEVEQRVGFFHFNLMWVLAGVLGVFLALDLFLFYFFWELMLVPMYFVIGIWGHEGRIRAAIKFFLFTQASGLLMLLAILGLVFVHQQQTGQLSFDYLALLHTPVRGSLAMWLMLGFFVAFAVKLPVVPLHPWLADAHSEAPTAGSVILAGLLLKTGAYGLLRFAVPLFPQAAATFAPVAMALGAVGVLYGALLAYGQTDLKRLVAYTSVSHLGFVLLGIYAFTSLAREGAILEMLAHGLSTGGLFVLAGGLQERLHSRDVNIMGGFAERLPRMGAVGLILAMATLGLPGLGNFVAEFLVLVGSYAASAGATVAATIGLIVATAYALRMVQRVFFGKPQPASLQRGMGDLTPREMGIFVVLVAGLLWLGLYPRPVLQLTGPPAALVAEAAAPAAESPYQASPASVVDVRSAVSR